MRSGAFGAGSIRRADLVAVVLIATMGSAGCGGAADAGRPTPRGRGESSLTDGDATRTQIAFVPPVGSAWVAGLDADGDSLVVLGALRARVGVEDAVFGLSPFASEIALAVEVERGWVFVAEDGTVARSATFTGPLERLGAIDGVVPIAWRGPGSRGRVAAIDEMGRLFVTDGTDAPRRVETLPAPGTVIQAVFLDVSRGAAILDGGALAYTSDGGETWRSLAGADAPATELGIEADEILVHAVDGSVRAIARDGVARSYDEAWETQGPAVYPRARWLRRMALWVFPEIVETLGVATIDGRAAALFDEDGVVGVRPGTARATDRVAVDPETCTLAAWGVRVLVLCENRGPIVLEASGRFRERAISSDLAEVVELPVGQENVALSQDGRHAARRSGCGEPSDAHVCVTDDEARTWRAVGLPRDVLGGSVVAMHDDRLLVSGTDPNGKPILVVVEVGSGRWRRIEVSANGEPPAQIARVGVNVPPAAPVDGRTRTSSGGRVDLEQPRFAVDGTLFALARASGGGAIEARLAMLAIGPSDGPLVLHPLPRGATTAAMSSAVHGVASGARPTELWETRDGGHTWRAVHAPLDGRVRAGTHLGWGTSRAERTWACRADACRLGRIVSRRVSARAPRRLGAREAIATDLDGPRGDRDVGRVADEPEMPELVCGDPEPMTVAPLPAFAPSGSVTPFAVASPGARARIASWRDASGRTVWQMAWSGLDARGAFVRTSATSPSPFSSPEADVARGRGEPAPADRAEYALRVVTRRGALVTRLSEDAHAPDGSARRAITEHAWVSANGGVRVVLDGVPPDPNAELIAAEALVDGGAVAAWRVPAEAEGIAVTRVVRLSSLGATRAVRDVVTTGAVIEGLAFHGTAPGFVTRDRATGGWMFVALDGAITTLPVRATRELPVCGDTPGRLRVSVGAPLLGSRRWSSSPTLELDAEGRACVRAVSGSRHGDASATFGLWASGGVLEGMADGGGDRSARIRCRLSAGVTLVGEDEPRAAPGADID